MTYSHTKRAEILPGIYYRASRGVTNIFSRFFLLVIILKLLFLSIIKSITSLLFPLKFILFVLFNLGNSTKFT